MTGERIRKIIHVDMDAFYASVEQHRPLGLLTPEAQLQQVQDGLA